MRWYAPGRLAVLELGLGHRGLEVDVPERRCLGLVCLPGRQQAEEPALGGATGALVDGRVGLLPVDREPQPPPRRLERPLVLGGEPVTELDEVRPRDTDRLLGGLGRGLETGVVGQGGVAAGPEVVLHPPLGGEPVVVPAHRVEDVLAPHAVEPGHRVGVRVGEDVPDVQGPRHRRGRGVDGEHVLSGGPRVEPVGRRRLPSAPPTSPPGRRGWVGRGPRRPPWPSGSGTSGRPVQR